MLPTSSPTPLSAKAILYVVVTYVLSLLLIGIYFAVGGTTGSSGRFALSVIYMFVPLVAAIVIQRVAYREPIALPLRIGWQINRWWLAAWLIPAVLAAATLGVSLLLPTVQFSTEMHGLFGRYQSLLTPEQMEEARNQLSGLPVHPAWFILLQAMIAGVTVNTLAAFGEEAGWRGLLLSELLPLGAWKSSLMIGAVWGLWHAPLVLMGHNYPDHPGVGVLLMVIFCVLLSPLLTLVTLRGNSVLAAAILHGTINGVAFLPIAMVEGGSDLATGLTGLPGIIVLLAVNAVLFATVRIDRTDMPASEKTHPVWLPPRRLE